MHVLRTTCIRCEGPVEFYIKLEGNSGIGETTCSRCNTNWRMEMTKPNRIGDMTATWIDQNTNMITVVNVKGTNV